MATLYSQSFGFWQGVAPGATITLKLEVPTAPFTAVIREITAYCGNPSPTAPNSWVMTSPRSFNGTPTIAAYDSGITSSSNPIFIRQACSTVFQNIGVVGSLTTMWSITNTAAIAASDWDFTVSGWVLTGSNATVVSLTI